ncbi:MAG TPA: VIT1/CCC1 transporter family protein [Candidatus Thermoplasmatota archaeon]
MQGPPPAAPPMHVAPLSPQQARELRDNWVDERSSAWLYRELARRSRDARRKELLNEFAEMEDAHAAQWAEVLGRRNLPLPRKQRVGVHRLWVAVARIAGVGVVLPVIHRHEVEAISKYLAQEAAAPEGDVKRAYAAVVPDEIVHETEILRSIQAKGDSSRGGLRSVVLGANDGLGSILALVAGVAGGVANSAIVLLAGLAGLVAGAVSMALSNYISVKSERELRDKHVEVQRIAVQRARELKIKDLRDAYLSRGMSKPEAEALSQSVGKDRERLVDAIVREQIGLGEASFERPGPLALYTGVAFVIAGAIPVVPFFFLGPAAALSVALVASAAALFMAGVIKSLVTLGPMLRGGLEMLLIGLGSAAATYALGTLIGQVAL